MDSFDILVIILSIALAVFLLLAIVFMVFLIKTIRRINAMTEKAQGVVNNVESASKIFQQAAGPVAVTKVVANVIEMFKEEKSNKKRKRKGTK